MPMGTPLDRKVRLGGRAGRMWWITVLVCMLFMPSGIEGVPLTGSEAEYRPYCTYQLADAMTVLCLFWELTGCGRDWEDRVAMVRLGMLTFLAPSFMEKEQIKKKNALQRKPPKPAVVASMLEKRLKILVLCS